MSSRRFCFWFVGNGSSLIGFRWFVCLRTSGLVLNKSNPAGCIGRFWIGFSADSKLEYRAQNYQPLNKKETRIISYQDSRSRLTTINPIAFIRSTVKNPVVGDRRVPPQTGVMLVKGRRLWKKFSFLYPLIISFHHRTNSTFCTGYLYTTITTFSSNYPVSLAFYHSPVNFYYWLVDDAHRLVKFH